MEKLRSVVDHPISPDSLEYQQISKFYDNITKSRLYNVSKLDELQNQKKQNIDIARGNVRDIENAVSIYDSYKVFTDEDMEIPPTFAGPEWNSEIKCKNCHVQKREKVDGMCRVCSIRAELLGNDNLSIEEKLTTCLTNIFKLNNFRTGQLDIISNIMSGEF